jgi:hypothetical protein
MRRNALWVFGGALVASGIMGLLSASCIDDSATTAVIQIEGGVDVIVIHEDAGPHDGSVYIYSDGSVVECPSTPIGTATIYPCSTFGDTYCLQAQSCRPDASCGNNTSGQPITRIQCNTAVDCNKVPAPGADDAGDAGDDAGNADGGDAGPTRLPIQCCASVSITDAGYCPIGIAPNNAGNITNCAYTCENSQLTVCTVGGNECPSGQTCRPGLSDFGGFKVTFGFCY